MLTIGAIMRMFFIKDPEGHGSNVIVKAFYYDKVWIQYEQSGVDELIDITDVAFHSPIPGDSPNHDFIARDNKGTWLFWKADEGFWYECSDPTVPNTTEVEATTETYQGEKPKTLH